MYDEVLALKEEKKYSDIYKTPAYRVFSPALHIIKQVAGLAKRIRAKTVLDAGYGTGRSLVHMLREGFDVTGIDIATGIADADIEENFGDRLVQGTLWELPFKEGTVFDFIYSVDVLEHIPPEKVNKVLSELCKVCTGGVYLEIALFKDNFKGGDDPLHLSLFSIEEWKERINKYFKIVHDKGSTNKYICFATPKEK